MYVLQLQPQPASGLPLTVILSAAMPSAALALELAAAATPALT